MPLAVLLFDPAQPGGFDFAGAIGARMAGFTAGIAGLGPVGATLALTVIALTMILSPVARQWAEENKRLVGSVIFGLIIIGLIPAFVAAIG
jgi:hypothetical protein